MTHDRWTIVCNQSMPTTAVYLHLSATSAQSQLDLPLSLDGAWKTALTTENFQRCDSLLWKKMSCRHNGTVAALAARHCTGHETKIKALRENGISRCTCGGECRLTERSCCFGRFRTEGDGRCGSGGRHGATFQQPRLISIAWEAPKNCRVDSTTSSTHRGHLKAVIFSKFHFHLGWPAPRIFLLVTLSVASYTVRIIWWRWSTLSNFHSPSGHSHKWSTSTFTCALRVPKSKKNHFVSFHQLFRRP